MRHRPRFTPPVLLFIVAFFAYNANLREISSYDTMGTRVLPVTLLQSFDLDMDEFDFFYSGRFPPNPDSVNAGPTPSLTPYWVQHRRDHFVSAFPVGAGVLVAPMYAPAVILGWFGDPDRVFLLSTLLAKLSASLLAALSVSLVYLTARRITGPRESLWVAVIYGFATSTWAISSQGLWQVSVSQPCLVSALYCLVRIWEDEDADVRWYTLAGLALAFSVAARPTNALPAATLTLFVLHARRSRLPHFAWPAVVVAVLLFAYNHYWYGSILGGYGGTSPELGLPSPYAFAGLLVSPSRGLLAFSPVLLFALPGAVESLRNRDEIFWRYVVAAAATIIVFYSAFAYWHGHHAWGYRHLVDLLPFLALFMAKGLSGPLGHRPGRIVLGTLTAYSIAVQLIGVLNYPCGWDGGVDPFVNQERLWDLRDTQIQRCLLSGPVYPDGLRVILGGPSEGAS